MAIVESEEPLSIVTEQTIQDASANAETMPTGAEATSHEAEAQAVEEVEQVPFPVSAETPTPDEGEAQAPAEVEQVPFPIAVDAQAPAEVEQVPFPVAVDAQAPEEVEQVPLSIAVDAQAPAEVEQVPFPVAVDAQAPVEVEQVPFPADFEKLPDDVSEPAPWTWLSYLENEQIVPAATPAAEEPEQSATESSSVALQQVEDAPIAEKGQRAPARKRTRKVTQQDKNT